MTTVSDIVEALKFFPGRPGRLVLRLLRHPEPVVSLFTEDDPLSYGAVDITVEGKKITSHKALAKALLVDAPEGKSIMVVTHPRPELQRWATVAEFAFCDLDLEQVPVRASDSSWDLLSPSGTRLNRAPEPRKMPPPGDPDSILS